MYVYVAHALICSTMEYFSSKTDEGKEQRHASSWVFGGTASILSGCLVSRISLQREGEGNADKHSAILILTKIQPSFLNS